MACRWSVEHTFSAALPATTASHHDDGASKRHLKPSDTLEMLDSRLLMSSHRSEAALALWSAMNDIRGVEVNDQPTMTHSGNQVAKRGGKHERRR